MVGGQAHGRSETVWHRRVRCTTNARSARRPAPGTSGPPLETRTTDHAVDNFGCTAGPSPHPSLDATWTPDLWRTQRHRIIGRHRRKAPRGLSDRSLFAAFLLAENRNMPMHVGGLQLFEKPEVPGATTSVRCTSRCATSSRSRRSSSSTRTGRSARPASVWQPDAEFDIEHHVRHSALPKPGRIRELLDLCSRLHSTRLAWERPLWEAHIIEGLRDGRVAMYTKTHHRWSTASRRCACCRAC